MAKTVTIYQYPKCSTCSNALKWLTAHGIAYDAIDLVAKPISVAKLADLHKRSGLPLAKLFNTSGESYREGGWKDRLKTMTEKQAIEALSKDGKLVKRPILDTGQTVLVGFDETKYETALA